MSTKLAHIRQFVTRVVSFTSEYSNTNWSSANLIGEPSSGNIYGDTTRAWCPSVDNENQALELEFEWPVYIERVNVYENLRGGSVTKIEAHNSINNEYETVWCCESPSFIEHYNIFSPDFDCIQFMSNRIRLTLTLENRSGFAEIEAVELIGFSIQIQVPDQTINSDISRLLFEQIFPDLDVEVIESETKSHVFKLHRCILKLRSEKMFDFFSKLYFKVNNLSIADMKLLIEFVYSDQLNENLLKEIINNEKLNNEKSLPEESSNTSDETDETDQDEDENACKFDYKNDEEKWMLVLNRLVRFSIYFKQERLTQLLIKYLVTNFLNAENVLNILLDSMNYTFKSTLSSAQNMEITCNELCFLQEIGAFNLESITEICLAFCRQQLKSMVKMKKFRQLPKKILIEIISGL